MPATVNPHNPGRGIEVVRRNYGTTLTLASEKAQMVISGWMDGLTLTKIAAESGLDTRAVWSVLDRAVDAKLIPPLTDAVKARTGRLVVQTQQALEEELDAPRDDRDANAVKAYWIGVGIGMDKIGASEQVQVNHAHVHVHAVSGPDKDAATRYAQLLSGEP
jgi:hypothetical protein